MYVRAIHELPLPEHGVRQRTDQPPAEAPSRARDPATRWSNHELSELRNIFPNHLQKPMVFRLSLQGCLHIGNGVGHMNQKGGIFLHRMNVLKPSRIL